MTRALGLRAVGAALLIVCPTLLHAQASGSTPASSVTLLPGDAIKLTVWRMKDMTGEYQIDEDGVVILPLLGPRKVTGIPVPQLRQSLAQEFGEQLNNPSIEIVALRQIYVLGEVKKPGRYSVDPTVTLAGAIAVAEGPTPDGDIRRISVTRAGQTIRQQVEAESTLANIDVRSGDQIFVGQRGWFERNSTFLVNLGVSMAFTVVNLLLIR